MKIALVLLFGFLLTACGTQDVRGKTAALMAESVSYYCEDGKYKLETTVQETDIKGKVVMARSIVDCGNKPEE